MAQDRAENTVFEVKTGVLGLKIQVRLGFCANDVPLALCALADGKEAGEAVFDVINDAHAMAGRQAGAVSDSLVGEIDGFFGRSGEWFEANFRDG